MELVFYDKDERETDLLCEELESYNPMKIIKNPKEILYII